MNFPRKLLNLNFFLVYISLHFVFSSRYWYKKIEITEPRDIQKLFVRIQKKNSCSSQTPFFLWMDDMSREYNIQHFPFSSWWEKQNMVKSWLKKYVRVLKIRINITKHEYRSLIYFHFSINLLFPCVSCYMYIVKCTQVNTEQKCSKPWSSNFYKAFYTHPLPYFIFVLPPQLV